MTLRLGFVGVGRWGQKLAEAFRACGAEIVAHDRRRDTQCFNEAHASPLLWGERKPWRVQLADDRIDAIIAVAPPEVTTEVALACAAAGKPVMATKPLQAHPERATAPFYVDLWRLQSEACREFRARIWENPEPPFAIELHGNGPFRGFHGLLDYGPHVMAELLKIAGGGSIVYDKITRNGEGNVGTYTVYGTAARHLKFKLVMGNGSTEPRRVMSIGGVPAFVEEGEMIGGETKSAALRRFCKSFLTDIAEGFADQTLLRLSRDAAVELGKIREMAVGA